MSTSSSDFHHIIVARVVNDLLRSSKAENTTLELPLLLFLADLNTTAIAYKETFHYAQRTESLDEDFVVKLIKESEFNTLLSLEDNIVLLRVPVQLVKTMLGSILVDSSIRYSKHLVRELNELDEKYKEIAMPKMLPPISELKPDLESGDGNSYQEESAEAGTPEEEIKPAVEIKLDAENAEAMGEDSMDIDREDQDGAIDVAEAEEKSDELVETIETVPSPHPTDHVVINEVADAEEVVEEVEVAAPVEEPSGADKQEETSVDVTEEKLETEEEVSLDVTDKVVEVEKKALVALTTEDTIPEVPRIDNKRSLSPLASTQKRKRFQNIAINLIKTIEEHRFSSPFLNRVHAENYDDVVYEPKDLKSILKAIKQKEEPPAYETVKELERDIILMFANCVMFNKSSTHLVKMAKEMKDDGRKAFKMFEDAELEIK